MGWNDPGDGRRDPWGGGGGEQGPPDLDEVVRRLQARLGRVFGRGGRGGGIGRGGAGGILGVIVVALVVWGLSGIYIVDEGKRGVVLRFGAYRATTLPGPHWHIPYPVERVELVDVERRRFVEVGYRSGVGGRGGGSVPAEALMLTADENIVDIRLAVQYQVSDPRKYLFSVRDPDETLKQATESAVREIVGRSRMDFVLTEGRAEVATRVRELLQTILDGYDTGLRVTNVTLQDAQPPEEVQAAFADAIKAREDEQRLKNEAEAYANEIIPKARGAAARQLEEAAAYREEVIARAQGEVQRFRKLLEEYRRAPDVTRERLYLETIEAVLANAGKVVLDTEGAGMPLIYLPVDRMLGQQGADGVAPVVPQGSAGGQGSESRRRDVRERERLRSGRTR
ncbi:FtsH protease activity modulator HflK [Inmirania thermothiophila]|uniref:Protein HflK n=1 Tax=Inmirania thermothiophila TaxID=1750597 RepID=A0A3N1Y0I5_9GAMM|nr:FtsH protease activity modulator HflK [Inmirania thermothiophila]ROR32031.1 protease FtsH subunit HflK [Inmirania thermothiophila]